MVRRIASQVHKQASRLLKNKYIRSEPVWYQAVLEHPPLPLPPRATSSRSAYDLPEPRTHGHASKPVKPPKLKTQPVVYLEDEIRRQFFRDHPFEAFRPRTLVETGEVQDVYPTGEQWTRLSQHTRNPTAEDAIRFALNLHEHHYLDDEKTKKIPLSRAYGLAVLQFRALRAEHEIATNVAVLEAESYGAVFGPSEIQKHFDQEQEYLRTWEVKRGTEDGVDVSRKRWRAILDKRGDPGVWSQGKEYVRLWQEGKRPDYSPALAAAIAGPDGAEKEFLEQEFLELKKEASPLKLTR